METPGAPWAKENEEEKGEEVDDDDDDGGGDNKEAAHGSLLTPVKEHEGARDEGVGSGAIAPSLGGNILDNVRERGLLSKQEIAGATEGRGGIGIDMGTA